MSDSIKDITGKIRAFRDARDWMQFHDPKSMAASISIEAAELLEHFQWLSAEQSKNIAQERKHEIGAEMADIAMYLFEMADNLDIDLSKAIKEKMQKNEMRYPIEKAKGVNTKYTDFQS